MVLQTEPLLLTLSFQGKPSHMHSGEHAGTVSKVLQSESSLETLVTINLQFTDLQLHYHSASMLLIQQEMQFSLILFSEHLATGKIRALTKLKTWQKHRTSTNSSCRASHLK